MKTRPSSHFDLFTTGVGALTRVTEVTPADGMPHLAVRIAARRGSTTSSRTTLFDATVSGRQAHDWVRRLADDVARGRHVLIRFRLSGLEGVSRAPKRAAGDDRPGIRLRTRLIGVDWARVDGRAIQPDRQAA